MQNLGVGVPYALTDRDTYRRSEVNAELLIPIENKQTTCIPAIFQAARTANVQIRLLRFRRVGAAVEARAGIETTDVFLGRVRHVQAEVVALVIVRSGEIDAR